MEKVLINLDGAVSGPVDLSKDEPLEIIIEGDTSLVLTNRRDVPDEIRDLLKQPRRYEDER